MARQDALQLIPEGVEVTEPDPVNVKSKPYVTWVKVAVTEVAADTAIAQVPMPVQPPPDQPLKA